MEEMANAQTLLVASRAVVNQVIVGMVSFVMVSQ